MLTVLSVVCSCACMKSTEQEMVSACRIWTAPSLNGIPGCIPRKDPFRPRTGEGSSASLVCIVGREWGGERGIKEGIEARAPSESDARMPVQVLAARVRGWEGRGSQCPQVLTGKTMGHGIKGFY